VLAATVDPMVAVASEITTDSRIPAKITGSASGSSILISLCQPLIPIPRAASITAGGRPVSPVSVFSKIGSNPYKNSATNVGAVPNPSVGTASAKTATGGNV